MRIYKTIFFAILTLCFSIVAQASDSSLKAGFTFEPQYAVISGLDIQVMELVANPTSEDIAYMADHVAAYNLDFVPIIEEMSRLSITDKDFYYSDIKVLNAAKMQNQNFDRVLISYNL